MKTILGLILILFGCCACDAQNIEGQIIASQYGKWKVPGYAANTYNAFAPGSCRVQGGASFFFAFNTGTPLLLSDADPSHDEVVSPTAVVNSNVACAITIAPTFDHQLPFFLASGTGGLQEALSQNLTNPQANTVILDNTFYSALGGSANVQATIAIVQGNIRLGLEDVTQVPTVWYQWNGTKYVRVGNGGVGTGLNTLTNDLVANSADSSGAMDLYDFVSSNTFTPQQAVNAALAGGGTAQLQPSAGRPSFTNTGNVRVTDNRTDIPATARGVTEFGAACDTTSRAATFSAGSTAVTVYGITMDSTYVGKAIVAAGLVGTTPTQFETVIASVQGISNATVTSPFPFNQATAHAVTIGHDDTAAIAQGLSAVGNAGTLVFPEGSCLTHTQILTGQSPVGLGPTSAIIGVPGEDVFLGQDPSVGTGTSQGSAHIHDLSIAVNSQIDATQPWQRIRETVTTAVPGMYRPIFKTSARANNPLGPGWFKGPGTNNGGAINGVASITAGTTIMCVPASEAAPAVGQQVVFPYLASVFTATVASNSGSCAAGTAARTLSSALPSGTTNTQAEWFAGSSVQSLAAAVGSGVCPATLTLNNSVAPAPGYESNVAGNGLIQIDGEQFSYFGATVAANPSPDKTLYGIQCAQNGTVRSAHSTNATVVPLNPFKPAYPFPVTPTLNSGDTTPAGTAGFYPGGNAGNQAFAFPVASGFNSGTGAIGSWNGAIVEHLSFSYFPNDINYANVGPWQGVNNTGAMYFVQLPYSTKFFNLMVFGLFYGITEGVPSIENGNWAHAQPTADGTSWDQLLIHAANPMVMIAGNQNSYHNANAYSQEGGGINSASDLGADTCFYFTQEYNDQTGGAAQESSLNFNENFYCEPEGGPHAGVFPTWEWDTNNSEIHDMHMGGGGEVRIGGFAQHFFAGNFNNNAVDPAINYGYGNTSDYSTNLGGGTRGNVYGTSPLLNWGPETNFNGQTGQADSSPTGPYGFLQSGNSRQPIPSQTAETFFTGNLTSPYTSMDAGFITPDEFNTSFAWEPQPFSVGWTFDDSSPITHAYAACNVGNNVNFGYCLSYNFNQDEIGIGAGQRIVPGKYSVYMSARDAVTASNTWTVGLGSTCRFLNGYTYFNLPVTTTWPTGYAQQYLGTVDFSADTANCRLEMASNGATTTDQIRVGFLALVPLPENFNAQTINVTNFNMTGGSSTGGNANGCAQSPITGIQGGFTCPTKGWLSSLAANQAAADTTISLSSTTGLSPSGCFFVDGEYECYAAIAGTTLTGLTRGTYLTTVGAHNAGAPAVSVNLVLGSLQQLPSIVETYGGGEAPIFSINNATPSNHAGTSVFSVNSGANETWIDGLGTITQEGTGVVNNLQGSLLVGTLLTNHPSIADTGYLMQVNGQNTAYQPLSLGGGHAGSLNVTTTPTIGAPLIAVSAPSGSTTVSYVCAGTDFDGNLIPGTTATVSNGAASWAFPVGYQVSCPWAAGVNTYQIYRTAGGPSQGLMLSGVGPALTLHDFGGAASGGTPPSVNGSNPHISVAGVGNPTILLGTGGPKILAAAGAPPAGCGSTYANGSLYVRTDGSVSASSLLWVCDGGTSAWVDVK